MLALAAVNIGGALGFGLVYAAAATRVLAQPAFLLALALVLVGLTTLWVRVERARGHRHDPLTRLGRIAAALGLTVVATPALALVPLFALKQGMPAEVPLDAVIRSVMVLLLIALVLVGIMNVAGVSVVAGSALVARLRRAGSPSS